MSIDSDRAGPRTRQPVPEFLVLLAVPAVVSATVGFAASYVAMRHYLDDLGWLSYLAPAVIELTIGYLAVSLVYRARRGGRWRPERLLVYAGIALAAYLKLGRLPQRLDLDAGLARGDAAAVVDRDRVGDRVGAAPTEDGTTPARARPARGVDHPAAVRLVGAAVHVADRHPHLHRGAGPAPGPRPGGGRARRRRPG